MNGGDQDPSPCPDTTQYNRRPSDPYRRIRLGTAHNGQKAPLKTLYVESSGG